jgi:kumamolisin
VATGRANPHTTIEVTLKLRRKKALPAMTGRPAAVMTRQQLAETYGASQEDIDQVVQTFSAMGLKAVATNAATRTVRLSGPISAMEQAFQTRLFNYAHSGGNYRGRVGAVHVPAAVTDIVEGVFGLDNRQVARRRRQPVRNSGHARLASVPSAWYLPSDLAAHYNFPPGDGSGQAVGLLEFGGGYFADDLAQYCTMAKIPTPPNVTAISTDGTPTDSTDGAEGEVMLDVEVVAGLCPKAHIVVYFAQFTEQGWITAIDAAVHDQNNDPGVVSVSWGEAEDTDIWTDQAMAQVNESFKDAAAVGGG